MLWNKLIGSRNSLSGVVLVDAQGVNGGSATTLNLGSYQNDRVLIFGCYVRNSAGSGVPSDLLVDSSALTKTGSNSLGTAGYLYGISNSLTSNTCSFQPTSTATITDYFVAVWAVYGILAGSFSDTNQSEASAATSRTTDVNSVGDSLFAIAIGFGETPITLNMGTNGVVDSTGSWAASGSITLYYAAGHRNPSSTQSVSVTQTPNEGLLLYIASAT
jgi:hypothetical protein